MKFGHEYETALANEGFPPEWVQSAIQYKYLKKVIKKVHRELEGLGLDVDTIHHLSAQLDQQQQQEGAQANVPHADFLSLPEGFSPQLRILVDSQTGTPLDVTLTPETRASLRKLARNQQIVAGRRQELGDSPQDVKALSIPTIDGENAADQDSDDLGLPQTARRPSSDPNVRAVLVPLASAGNFFDMLRPKLDELDHLRDVETHNLEEEILDLGEAVEDVVQPVREGFEAYREVSYRDLYFWREMFRLYLEKPIFYSGTERNRGALTFAEARHNLEEYDGKLRSTGLLAKMKTPAAKAAAQQFLDVNVHILKTMHFQEMNARAMRKILKKFDKQTHLEGRSLFKGLQTKYPALLTDGSRKPGGFADSIARDLQAEMGSKVLAIVPQLDDWICPVCYSMAWRPVNLGCCRSVFCITCVIKLQQENMKRCPMCNAETVMKADGRNIDFETMDFLEKFFPLEVKKRQKENEKAQLARDYGEDFVKPGCSVM